MFPLVENQTGAFVCETMGLGVRANAYAGKGSGGEAWVFVGARLWRVLCLRRNSPCGEFEHAARRVPTLNHHHPNSIHCFEYILQSVRILRHF